MTERKAKQDALHRSFRRWHVATAISAAWAIAALALLPFGPDILIFLFSIAPTDWRTALVVGWIVMIALASAMTALTAWRRHRARRRALDAGVELGRRRLRQAQGVRAG
jgi:hypothetical protein